MGSARPGAELPGKVVTVQRVYSCHDLREIIILLNDNNDNNDTIPWIDLHFLVGASKVRD